MHPNNQMTPCDHFGDCGNEKLLFNRKNQEAQSCESWRLYSPPDRKHEFDLTGNKPLSPFLLWICVFLWLWLLGGLVWISVELIIKNPCETLLSNCYGYSRRNKSSLGHSRPQTQIHRVSFNFCQFPQSQQVSGHQWWWVQVKQKYERVLIVLVKWTLFSH